MDRIAGDMPGVRLERKKGICNNLNNSNNLFDANPRILNLICFFLVCNCFLQSSCIWITLCEITGGDQSCRVDTRRALVFVMEAGHDGSRSCQKDCLLPLALICFQQKTHNSLSPKRRDMSH